MGYAFVTSNCLTCRRPFSYNPLRVPSKDLKDGRGRQPICQGCMILINRERAKKGLEPFEVYPDAYEPVDERELP